MRRHHRRSSLRKWWAKEFLFAEWLSSLVVAGGLLVAVYGFNLRPVLETILAGNRSSIYGTLAVLFGSLLGFTLTAVTIILSFAHGERLGVVRRSEHYSTLWETFQSTIRWLATATFAALLALIFDRLSAPKPWLTVIVFFTAIVCMARIGRIIWILEMVIALLTSERET